MSRYPLTHPVSPHTVRHLQCEGHIIRNIDLFLCSLTLMPRYDPESKYIIYLAITALFLCNDWPLSPLASRACSCGPFSCEIIAVLMLEMNKVVEAICGHSLVPFTNDIPVDIDSVVVALEDRHHDLDSDETGTNVPRVGIRHPVM